MGIPALRFEEFRGDWKNVPITDCLQLMTDFVANGSFESLKKNVSVYTDIDFAYYVRLYDLRLGLGHSKQTYVDEKSYKFLKKSTLKSGDILIANIGANVGEVWETPLLDKPATIAPNMILLKVSSSTNESYLFHYLKTELGEKEIKSTVSGSGQPKVNKTELKRVRVKLPPSLEEQTKIANFLNAVDEKITQLSQKHDLLIQYKKGVMQQIFSQELRFKDDDGGDFPEWEEKSLRDVGSFFSGGTPLTTRKDFYDGSIPFIKSGELGSDSTSQTITELGLSNSSAKLVKKGDLLYALYGATSGELAVSKIDGAINQAVLCIRTSLNTYYLYSYLLFQKSNILKTYLQGGQGNLSADIIKSLVVPIPYEKEQTKIASFLSAIDYKITQIQAELAAVKQYKQGLLQQMFV